jgi:hypothetical protein
MLYVGARLIFISAATLSFLVIPQFREDISPTASPDNTVKGTWIVVIILIILFAVQFGTVLFIEAIVVLKGDYLFMQKLL